MLMQTKDLTGPALDWAVAKCEWNREEGDWRGTYRADYSTDWAQGGPIIAREKLCIDIDSAGVWLSWTKQNYDDEPRHMVSGHTPLISAMRCYAASKLGDTVDVPDELA